MFENIIGQSAVVKALGSELSDGRFPPSSLFFGPTYSGKLSVALETARVLTCARGTAEWSCECPSCRLQKDLSHPQTVLLGARYSDVEIAASADALLRSRKPASRYLLVRAVRKLTRRFDPSIADADDSKVKGMQDRVSHLEELLSDLSPDVELPPDAALGKLLEKIVTAAAPIAAQVRSDMIGIGQVRRLAAWSHLTAGESRKIAILENADRMQDSARNALLKLLEEPPSSVTLILLTTRRAAIIPTILSRLRPYSFGQRPAEEEKEVMLKIFRREDEGFAGLRGFFLAWREINPEKLAQLAQRFVELARSPRDPAVDIVEEMAELLPEGGPRRGKSSRETMSSFLEELSTCMGSLLRSGTLPADALEKWSLATRDAASRIESLNMQPAGVLEALYYRLRAEASA
jgi:DNA polymerase III delta prime subunit